MTTLSTTTTLPLSARLREATSAAHTRAEGATFLDELMSGRRDLAAWGALLEQLAPVYAALEAVRPQLAVDPAVAPLLDARLDRSAALERDLAAFRAAGVPEIGIVPAAEEYAARIRATADDAPRYLAHHYTRYLGDLSGGRVIRTALERQYGLPSEMSAFFEFPDLAPVPFKRAYRAAIDEWQLDAPAVDRLLTEANASFAANEAIFVEVGQALGEI